MVYADRIESRAVSWFSAGPYRPGSARCRSRRQGNRRAAGQDPRTRLLITMDRPQSEITALLHAHAAGESGALDHLLSRVYEELRIIARSRLGREQAGHTLSPTDLVHEAFLKLVPVERIDWRDRAHFFAIASRAMRNVLVDHAERRRAVKRGGGAIAVTLDRVDRMVEQPLDELIALSEALERLERLDARQAQVVECRFFGGLSLDETAEALGVSTATVSRDWTFARAWLHRELLAADPAAGDSPDPP